MLSELAVTGLGVISVIGQGGAAYADASLQGKHAFRVMERMHRQKDAAFLGAEVDSIEFPGSISKQMQRAASLSAQMALVVMQEAWDETKLSAVDPRRIGLNIGGSNTQQRELTLAHDAYRDRREFLRPTYGLSFMDADLRGFCTAQFSVRGDACAASGTCGTQFGVRNVVLDESFMPDARAASRGKGRLFLREIKEFHREYEWS